MAVENKARPFVSYVVHSLALCLTVMVLVWNISFRGGLAWEATNKELIFNIHPVLMLIGLVILGGEAIISFKSFPLNKQQKKVIHLVLHTIALVLGIVGICAVLKSNNESGLSEFPNFYSLHSWIGIGVITLYGIQWLYGFVIFFYPGGSASLRSESIPWHILFGMFVYTLAVVNAAIGFLEMLTFLEGEDGLDKFGSEAFLVNFTAMGTILYGTFVWLSMYAQKDQEPEYLNREDHGYAAI